MTSIAQPRSERTSKGPHPKSRLRDAATLILIDASGPSPKVLLGRRHQRHAFMPDKFVFPGGRVEPADRQMSVAAPLKPQVEARLMLRVRSPSPARARAYALAAIRETFEETGLLLGVRREERLTSPDPSWDAFAAAGIYPDLGAVHFIARAITPPQRPRRFDARFFAADIAAVAHRVEGVVGPEAELVELVWMPLAQARELNVASLITRVVLDDLEWRIAHGLGRDAAVPFYHLVRRRFIRDLL